MRKLLLFVSVFGLGGLLLWAVNRASSHTPADTFGPPPAVTAPGEEAGADTSQPLPGAREGVGEQDEPPLFVRIDGAASIDTYAAGDGARRGAASRLEGVFHALDATFSSYRVENLTMDVLDPDSGEVLETLTAKEGTFRVELGPGSHALLIADGGRVLLEDVEFVRHIEHTFAPLTITAPRLEVLLGVNELRSVGDDLVTVEGRGLSGNGRGLLFQGDTGMLRLARGGEMVMQRGDAGAATISTLREGPLEIRQIGPAGSPGGMKAVAADGARLILEGENPGKIDAHTLTLVGHTSAEGVVLESGVAEGDVLAVRGDSTYSGARAQIKLDAAGELETLILEEQPAAEFTVRSSPDEWTLIKSHGEGPLTVHMGSATTNFELVGPGVAEAVSEGIRVEAQGVLRGVSSADRTRATITAKDKVVVTQGAGRLETDFLDAVFLAGELATAEIFCGGPTRVSQRDPLRGLVTVDVDEESEVRLYDERWVVVSARGVRMDVVGPEPMRVTAGLIQDLDLVVLRFRASEGTTWAGIEGDGSSHEATLGEDGVLRLVGTDSALASVRVAPRGGTDGGSERLVAATIRALEIDVADEYFDARGAVSADAETGDGRLELRANRARLDLAAPLGGAGGSTPFAMKAHGVQRASLIDMDATTHVGADEVTVSGVFLENGDQEEVQTSDLEATGNVVVRREGAMPLVAKGDWLLMEGEASGKMVADEGTRVHVTGFLPGNGRGFRLDAQSLVWEGAGITVERPDAVLQGLGLDPPGGAGLTLGEIRASARRLEIDEGGAHFTGGALMQGTDEAGVPLVLRSGALYLAGGVPLISGAGDAPGELQSVEASGGFTWVYGGLGRARGQRMIASRERIVLWGASGEPANIDVGRPDGVLSLESRFIEVDLERFLVSSDRGVIRSTGEAANWSLSYASMQPSERAGETLFALAAPRFEDGLNEARADFVSFWIDSERWRARGRASLWGEPMPLDQTPAPAPDSLLGPVAAPLPEGLLVENVFLRLADGELGHYLRAAYAEGNLDVTEEGRLVARASAAYLDMVRQQGVLEEATLVGRMQVSRGRTERVRVSAKKMRTAADGSLRAQRATLTTSTHDEPTYLIETRRLVLDPRPDGLWELSALGNRLVFSNRIGVPLPSFGNLALNRRGDVVGFVAGDDTVHTIDHLVIGDSARFGPMIGAGFRSDIGKIGRKVGDLLGFGEEAIGRWDAEVSYMGSRGALLGLGLEMRERRPEAGGDLWLKITARGIHDTARDRGLVRVPAQDRNPMRLWTDARGRYPFSEVSWVDLALSTQTDPGVQAEFFQREYQRYEKRDTYLHYRDGRGADYFDAMFRTRMDSYRTEILQLPSVGYYHGERLLGTVAGVEVLYGAGLELDSLSRREGDLRYEMPFTDSAGLPDGFGDRQVLRAHTSHRFSAPMNTHVLGVRATPWLEGSATAWDNNAADSGGATRAAAIAGADFSTTLYKSTRAGWRHSLTPSFNYRTDLLVEERGGALVRYDTIDDPLDGDEWGVGLRALWSDPQQESRYDLEVKGVHRFHRAAGLGDMSQLATLGSLRTTMKGVPVGLRYDGRVDLESGRTLYSRSTLSLRPTEPLLLQLVFRRGYDPNVGRLFEAASFDARWRIDPKWEIEVGEDISIAGKGNLRTHLALRRFGADFLLETVLENRAGEGGASFSLSFSPLFLWSPRRLGMLDD